MADPINLISVGSLRSLWDQPKEGFEPVVQCVSSKVMSSGPGQDTKFRTVFSDTVNFVQCMYMTKMSPEEVQEILKVGGIVRLTRYNAKVLKNRKVLILSDFDVVHGPGAKIGNPVNIDSNPEESAPTIAPNNFYGNKPPQPQPQPPQPQRRTGPAGGRSDAGANFYPIEAISPYSRTWTIKARCSYKSPIRTYHNRNGEGKLFNCNFIDSTGEIRATAFQAQVDRLHPIIEEGVVYCISSPCRVSIAKKEYSNVNNDYELMFEPDTVVERSNDEIDVPQIKFEFTSFADLQNVESGSTVDVVGILRDAGEAQQIVSKNTGKPYDKRELTLVDNSGFSVRLTVWGETANNFNAPPESVIAFKACKVSDFGGRSLSLLSSGSMNVDPDITEAHRLRGWYDANGKQENFATHSTAAATSGGARDPPKTIIEIKEQQLGATDTPDYFTVKATILMIRQETMYYPACASDNCNKKVTQEETGLWRCEKCNVSHEHPQ
ncbi:Replication factor A protein 1 [Ascosphaera atra]|nr:Replication factor A protein 1 [Ascosphaera atra]